MRSEYDDFVERARRRAAEDTDAAAAIRTLVTVPCSLRRDWLRGHATAGMVIALAVHARATMDLPLLDDAQELAAALTDSYDGPHARFVVWSARGAVLRGAQRFGEALEALDRAAAELDTASLVFAAALAGRTQTHGSHRHVKARRSRSEIAPCRRQAHEA